MVDEDRIERLERLVEQQHETIATLQEQVATLANDGATVSANGDEPANPSSADRTPSDYFSRRSILGAAAALGLGGYATGSASAAEPRGVAGSADHPVDTLHLDTLSGPITGGTDLTTLVGDGLAIEDGTLSTTGPSVAEYGDVVAGNPSKLSFEDNVNVIERDDEVEINVSDSNTNSQTDVSDGGTTVVESTSDVNFGNKLDVTDDGDGSATVDIPAGSIDSGDLAEDSVTVAGNTVSLGESIGVNHGDLDAVDQIAGSNLRASGGALNVDSQLDLGDFSSLTMGDFTFESTDDKLLQLTHSEKAAVFFAPDDSSMIDLGTDSQRWHTVYCESVDESSDARLKEDVADLGDGLERLDCIRPVSYQWKDADDPDTRLGFVAQELDDAVPEAVSRPDDDDGNLGVNNMMVTAVAVSAIQDQQDLIEDLDEECADLRSENEAFRERCGYLETRLAAVEDKLSTEGTSQAVADD